MIFINKFSFDPEIFLEVAKKLMDDENYDEKGRIRTAIGRAYYAAFLFAKKFLEEYGISFRDIYRLHQDVINKLNDRGYSNVSNKLLTLFDYRVDADYKPLANLQEVDCQKCIRISENIFKLIQEKNY